MLLRVDGVAKWFGAQLILKDISFLLAAGERVALVGENGVGKSTLLRVLAGETPPDAGSVHLSPDIDVGYLPQEPPAAPGQTIEGRLMAGVGLDGLAAEMRRLEVELAEPKGDPTAALAAYGEATERFEERGGYDIDHRVDQVLVGLSLSALPRDRLVAELSGGEKMRVALAGLLLRAPDLLLLDEPTNHLDFAALEWLGNYLTRQAGAVLIVSHDRRFLNTTVRRVLEIPAHSREIVDYPGDYDAYAAAKVAERRRWEAEYARQQEEIAELEKTARSLAYDLGHNRARRDNDKFSKAFFEGRAANAISRNVRSAEERLSRAEDEARAKPPEQLRIDPAFQPEAVGSDVPLQAEGLRWSYGDQAVLRDVSLTLGRDSRIVLVGPNGAGKTTLLRMLAGLIVPEQGTVTTAPGITIRYLDQEQESLKGQGTLFEAYANGLIGYEDDLRGELVRYGLFEPDDLTKQMSQLSAGQKRKLQIARLVATRANVLLLDEPTNHVHFDVLEELERALSAFPGPVLAVSHDRWFIERFASEVWELREGQLDLVPDVSRRRMKG